MPNLYERRIRKAKEDPEYWVLEEYRECDCPDCEKEGHWMQIAGTPKKEELEKRIA